MFVFLAIFVFALWAAMFPLGKLNLEHSAPFFLVGTRMFFAGAILLIYLFCKNRALLRISMGQLLSLAPVAIIGIYASNAFELFALQSVSAAKACMIFSLSPFFAALLSYIHFNEKMNLRKCLGLMIGYMGIVPILFGQKESQEILTSIPFLTWPELFTMTAAFLGQYGWVLLRKVVREIPSGTANAYSMIVGGALALLHSFFRENWAPIPVPTPQLANFGQILLIMIVVSNLICYNLYGWLLKRFTATFLSFIGLFSPIFASLSSWLILGEKPSLLVFLPMGIFLIGLWLVYSAEMSQGYMKKTPKLAGEKI